MPWRLSAVVVLFLSLAVILHYGSQMRANVFPETRDYPPTTAATVEAPAKPFLQLTHQVPSQTLAAGSMDGHITSQRAAPTSSSEPPTTHTTAKTVGTTSLITTNSTPTTSPTAHTLITTLATLNNSHTAAPVTEATVGPSAAPGSPPTTVPPVTHMTGTSPSTISPTTRKTTQPSNQTALPATLSTPPHNSTTSHKSAQPSHAPSPTTAVHNTTQTASPATTASRPTLAPRPSSAKTGIYQVLNGSRLCVKAEMGIELMVQETESVFSPQRYFNIDPNATQASGNCGFRKSNLLLNFQGGFVNFTFTKDENSYYINEVRAYLTVSNPETVYQGTKSSVVMFETVVGHSFKCVSEQSIQLSTRLQLKTMNVQYQAFDFEDDHFGNADECFTDRNRRENPVAVGLSIAVLLIVLLTACLVASKRPSRGYERM
ncbi:lysosome-associated membrane glycoprotein 3 isoform X1 [Ursus arctos]|uniref:lysosome-associated membrane glycoprotein 3 isoform X1 n=1 Tax=Ursus arctos TaxID=9644 RepID=UPI0025474721|nr:lysosome-associated membrane glycoprotein 3 isoform X1 [Ursus arctos]XP_057162627.1 lysosome-associated membrane glycoprotein 3 isoform X1 [Ursus arctos]